ncbi:TerD family protein [Candidatus Accumulibacter contiguus]|jgi:tellurium resistance protein TerZ|uniref:Stress response protein SCP2 n=2 Tax=Candidatus Accumulibacter TaxID=327159 RepID=A0A080LYM3_9PROT|nr:TerD family protein [Candidatus Accumulibacter contiguus]KFB73861.1 MAG: Stress response protein SCP2 [Candidatus Accumulibacter phosphatis]MBL8407087.1 TerD family protein [Accumulibacter sp.]NMQ03764.1 TerD family protein [Candidatus Accumulibacter contiguus]HRF10584.1 TerD family protein [Candidatus Accumulibacter phosphatis]
MAVSLQKGQKISLEKEAGGALNRVVMGLGWDAVKKKGFFGLGGGQKEIDLDASCLLFDENRSLLDVVWFRQLRSKDGSIQHSGDNLTGAGEGDDEQIIVNLNAVPANVKSLVFTVNSFTGQDFSQVNNAFCRIVDGANGKEIARYDLSVQGSHTAQIMAKVYRHAGEWKMHAIGENGSGVTFQDLLPLIVPHI